MTSLILSGGHLLGASGAILAVSGAAPAPQVNAPWFGTIASGGDQSYGSNQGGFGGATGYTTAAPSTQAYTAVQALGRNDIVFGLGGSFESWGTSATNRNKNDLVLAIKSLGTYPNVINGARGCYVFPYAIYESQIPTGSGYQTYVDLVVANNWWLYETSGGTGTMVPSAASGTGYFNVNYSYAWPGAAGTVPMGFTICGNAYGTQSNSQGPARTAAQYFVTALLSTDRTTDTRFSSLSTNGAAPAADGLNIDNLFSYPNAGGNLVTSASWDGQNLQTNASLVRWYDEAGDDSLTQVNVPRGWLGTPIATPITLSNGVLCRPFTGGCVLFNPWGNGAQTVTAAQLLTATGLAYTHLNGTQQPTLNNGATFVSYTFADADGLFLTA